MTSLNIQLLGPFQVTDAAGARADLKYDKVRAMLAYLAVESHQAHRREALAALLWPDLPHDASRNNVRQALHTLRQALDDASATPSYLITTRTTVQFNSESQFQLDIAAFEEALAFAGRHAHRNPHSCQTCAARLEQAATLYRGPFLSDLALPDSVPFEEWALLLREHANRLMLDALQRLLVFHERRGDYERAAQLARRQLDLEPWREQAHRALMRLHLLSDRRAAALAQFEACRQMLQEELGVEPEEKTRQLHQLIRDSVDAPDLYATLTGASVGAPFQIPLPPTPFVGRRRELEEIARLLDGARHRLITITGPGGVGKTRLALQAAADQMNLFTGGIFFLSLVSVSDAAQLPELIATVVNLEVASQPATPNLDAQTVARALAGRELLLVLDNFEHLVQDALILEPFLRHAPDVNLLVTSRQRLGLQAETVYPLQGLMLPASSASLPDVLTNDNDALKLFFSGAQRVGANLTRTPETVRQAARICRLLEGLPLGIELAAGWTGALSLAEIATEIEQGVQFLTARQRDIPPRHRSVWAVLSQTWERLSPLEQRLLARLSVFEGPFPRAAAESVAGASVATLADLIDKSILQRRPPHWYALHSLLRQFAAKQLQQSGAEQETRARLLEHYLRDTEETASTTDAVVRAARMQRIAAEYENLRAALTWAQQNEKLEEGLRLASALYRFWYWRSHFREGSRWLSALLQRSAGLPAELRAAAHYANGVLLSQQERPQEALANLQKSLILRRGLGDQAGQAACLNSLGILAWRRQSYEEATTLLEESLSIRRRLGDSNLGPPLNNLGLVAVAQGDYARAAGHFAELLRLARTQNNTMGIAIAAGNLALTLLQQDRHDEARGYLLEATNLFEELQDREGLAGCLESAAILAAANTRFASAVRLCAAASTLRQQIHVPLTAAEQQRFQETLSTAQSNLDTRAFDQAWQEGAALSLHHALRLIPTL